jgi:hypothetical protein
VRLLVTVVGFAGLVKQQLHGAAAAATTMRP